VNEEALACWGLLRQEQTNIVFFAAVGLVVITWFLIVSMVIIITAFLYWRCCCFFSSRSLIRAVNIQLNASARPKLLIWERGV
jgi:maltodextrin utilization protein YvdJ